MRVDATLVGVNQRDLVTFAVDTDRAVRMAPQMPAGVIRVAESGISGPDDAVPLAAAGYHAVLVGRAWCAPPIRQPRWPHCVRLVARPTSSLATHMFVKICGITSEEDALLAIAMGADAVGFVFAPSSRQVAAGFVRDIVRRLPPEVLTVGVFRDESPQRVVDIVNSIGLRARSCTVTRPSSRRSWCARRCRS